MRRNDAIPMVACYKCHGGSKTISHALETDTLFLCPYHNPMSDYNWRHDHDNEEALIEFLLEEHDIDEDFEAVMHAVDQKVDEYEGLVSRPAAVHLIAREEFGIELVDAMREDGHEPEHIDVADMLTCEIGEDGYGINKIDGVYKVRRVKTIDKRDDWTRADVVIYDDSDGNIELTLWDEMAEACEQLEANDEIQIEGGYVEKSDYGLSLNVSKKGRVVYPDGTEETGPDYESS